MTTLTTCRRGHRVLIVGIVLTMAATTGLLTTTARAKGVKFHSAPEPRSGLDIRLAEERGETIEPKPGIRLKGRLRKPKGDGPFPAVVLMHGCDGLKKERGGMWAARLNKWGYLTLQVDSFGPRGVSRVCKRQHLVSAELDRPYDAYGALQYLRGLPDVNPDRIAIMGWSNGGRATLAALHREQSELLGLGLGDPQFQAGIAFYPYCQLSFGDFRAPVLLLVAGNDTVIPPASCKGLARNPAVELKVYPRADHSFDVLAWGAYDRKASQDASKRVKAFLAKYLQ